jgi:hypothetical protein
MNDLTDRELLELAARLPLLPVLDILGGGRLIRMDRVHQMMREYAIVAIKAETAQAVLAERERCAKVCEDEAAKYLNPADDDYRSVVACAEAIRSWGASSVTDPAYKQEQSDKNAHVRKLLDE